MDQENLQILAIDRLVKQMKRFDEIMMDIPVKQIKRLFKFLIIHYRQLKRLCKFLEIYI